MNKFILDCSVYMSWCLNEKTVKTSSKILKSIIKNEIIVPGLWAYEVINILTISVRRNKLTVAETYSLINDIQLLPIEFDKPTTENLSNIFNIANEHNLSAYDAAYIELALRTNTQIASFDKEVIKDVDLDSEEILQFHEMLWGAVESCLGSIDMNQAFVGFSWNADFPIRSLANFLQQLRHTLGDEARGSPRYCGG